MHLRFSAGGPIEDSFERLDDLHMHLVVIGQPAPEVKADVQVHVLPDTPENARELARVGIPAQAFYLLRPDGYVGLSGATLQPGAVERYLAGRLHLS
jgi:hypothetical protein